MGGEFVQFADSGSKQLIVQSASDLFLQCFFDLGTAFGDRLEEPNKRSRDSAVTVSSVASFTLNTAGSSFLTRA
jgi:hypothetical protein